MLGALLCVASCLSTEGYYRYRDGGAAGSSGMAGSTGSGAAGRGGTVGTGGTAGTGTGGRVTGVAGTTGGAGRGGTTGSAGGPGRGGVTGTGASTGAVLFMDDFETGSDGWNFGGDLTATHVVVADTGSQVFHLNSTVTDQAVGAAGSLTWGDQVVEARVKVVAFNGTSSSDVAAICARLTDVDHFYYLAIQSDGKLKIKVNNSGNSSIGSSIDIGFALNTWYTLKLSVVGSTLTAYVNGAVVGTPVTNTELAGGATGLMVQATNAMFDDVVVRAP